VDSAVAEGRLGGLIEDACRDHGFSPDPADHTGQATALVDALVAEHKGEEHG
jgi:3-carboxy-cis,cis-muconate cycloisomerase